MSTHCGPAPYETNDIDKSCSCRNGVDVSEATTGVFMNSIRCRGRAGYARDRPRWLEKNRLHGSNETELTQHTTLSRRICQRKSNAQTRGTGASHGHSQHARKLETPTSHLSL